MLSNDDREWLEEKFSRLHLRIDACEEKIERKGSDIHKVQQGLIRVELEKCQDIKDHEERCHNPAKTWGILAAVMGVMTGVVELGKYFFRKG